MRFHSNYFFLNTYIYRQTNGYIAKNFRVFATNFSTYFVSLKYLIRANLVSSFLLSIYMLPEHHDDPMFASLVFNQLYLID